MLTGLTPHECGMLGLAHRGFTLSDADRHLSVRLRDAGYRTCLVGFQHEVPQEELHRLGYQELVLEQLPFESPARAQAAADWIANDPREPFFLNVGLLETHRKGDAQVFADLEAGEDGRHHASLPWLADGPESRKDMAALAKAVRNVDAAVGILLDSVERAGLLERTIFIYTTDHGVPFPRAKASLFDMGLGVALVAAGPGWPIGQVEEGLVSHLDLYPTLLEAGGAPIPEPVRGQSLLARWRGEVPPRESLFAEITYHAAYEPARAVRTTRWKYIRTYGVPERYRWPNIDDSPSKALLHRLEANRMPREPEALYDLALDPMEMENLASNQTHAEVLTRMRAKLEAWMHETSDPLLLGPVELPPGGVATPPEAYHP